MKTESVQAMQNYGIMNLHQSFYIFSSSLKLPARETALAGEHILKALTLHEFKTVREDEERAEAADRLQMEVIEESKLTEYEIVKLQWTEEREDPVNYGNGFHQQYYLCGRTKKDPEWRIYGVGFL